MPGLNIYVSKYDNSANRRSLNYMPVYEAQGLSVSQKMPYSGYPIHIWENERFAYIVEGFFYEWRNFKEKIEEFADAYSHSINKTSLLSSYFSQLDAEFVVVLYDKKKRITIVFNDVLGRLPLYTYENKECLIIARNAFFIEQAGKLSDNPQAFLETLVFGFSLGQETLYKHVNRIGGATVLEISEGLFNRSIYHSFNYEQIIDPSFELSSGLEEIKILFVQAIKNRTHFTDKNIIGLSGGLDSRALVGGFKHAGLPCELITYSDTYKSAQQDIIYARQIAEQYKYPWEILRLPEPTVEDFNELFELKLGLSSLDMSFLVSFYKHISSLSRSPGFFSGDGGDKVFPDLRPDTFQTSPKAITNYVIYANANMSPQQAADILGMDYKLMEEKIFTLLSSYPEEDWRYKYVHFIMENRVRNWLVEGEDRSRCYLNAFTPFYHTGLFTKLMSVPPDFKTSFRLYNDFLKSIAPESVNIPNANWGVSVAEERRIKQMFFKQKVKNTTIGVFIKKQMNGRYNYLELAEKNEKHLFFSLASTPEVRNRIDVESLKKIKYLNGNNFHHLMTLMKVINTIR